MKDSLWALNFEVKRINNINSIEEIREAKLFYYSKIENLKNRKKEFKNDSREYLKLELYYLTILTFVNEKEIELLTKNNLKQISDWEKNKANGQ